MDDVESGRTSSCYLITLPEAVEALRSIPVRYNRIWAAVAENVIPATKIGSRWFIDSRDLPTIAKQLGNGIVTDDDGEVLP